MSALKRYDPKQVICEWDGITLNEGIAEGTFIVVSRQVPRNALNVGADGNGTKVVNNNRSATITVTVRKGSAVNSLLTDRLRDEEKENPIDHTSAASVKDFSGNSQFQSPKAFLVGFPDSDFASDETNREWILMCLECDMEPRGSLEL